MKEEVIINKMNKLKEFREKVKEKDTKISIKIGEQNSLMELLNIPEEKKSFFSLKQALENLKHDYIVEKNRAENLENAMSMSD